MAPRPLSRPTARPSTRDRLSIEQIVAVDPPTAFRVSPDGRTLAYLAESAGARQLFTMPLRGGYPAQLTAFEKDVSDPQWNARGDRLAFVKEKAIWTVDADGGRPAKLIDHPAGSSNPRWAPDGDRLAFISRRRGWDQLWLVPAPRPSRGRPRTSEKPPEPVCLTPTPHDNECPEWSPDGTRIAFVSHRADDLLTQQIFVLDVARASGNVREEDPVQAPRPVAGEASWACAPAWAPDGRALCYLDDRDGWFQVMRVALGSRGEPGDATPVTSGEVEHGEPSGGDPYAPRVSPNGRSVAHVRIREGLVDIVVSPIPAGGAPRRTGRVEVTVNPFAGIWRLVEWTGPDHLAAIAENDERPQDLWILPVPGLATPSARPHQVTDSRPRSLPVHRFVSTERVSFTARDGLTVEGTLWRPPEATGAKDGRRVPVVIDLHGGPTWQRYRGWWPFFQLLAQEGMAVLAIDFRGSTGYGRAFRLANRGEWGHADMHDLVDGARWAASQPWADGRLASYGGSYGGYLTLCALVDEPSLWRCGVDMYGDSEIAESYRHGDRPGRIDLERMMGKPDDPGTAELYRRGSPLYRAERIEAPLLILHGRKDRRVVPLMSEKMIEALTIEGKYHEVAWYDEEGHGWTRRENRRDAYQRTLAFFKRHLLDEEQPAST